MGFHRVVSLSLRNAGRTSTRRAVREGFLRELPPFPEACFFHGHEGCTPWRVRAPNTPPTSPLTPLAIIFSTWLTSSPSGKSTSCSRGGREAFSSPTGNFAPSRLAFSFVTRASLAALHWESSIRFSFLLGNFGKRKGWMVASLWRG